ncbi:MorD protein [Mycolicibacterium mucogenicum]|uniref:MorD protein n=1 Tax=Mycolicibacterium mucogenicum TaxID=56689 RepID=A0A1A3GX00_MYCMU|nr:MorD protein [Mycolicibacterium mucogenicum]OBJ39908.1 MorD protein [Mycolicibacterium mucogenicum]
MSQSITAAALERACAVTAVALSERRRAGVRLISGEKRRFGLSASCSVIHVPYPAPAPDWSLRTYTCGVALQCAPSKDRIARYPLHRLSERELGALRQIEGAAALGWVARRWPGLLSEARRTLPGLEPADPDLSTDEILCRTDTLARSRERLPDYPLLGAPSLSMATNRTLASSIRRTLGRMPWSSSRSDTQRLMSIPVGGAGGVRSANLPPASRPEDDDLDVRPDHRAGIPYPEWNSGRGQFLPDHVAVLERRQTRHDRRGGASPDIRRWFDEPTHRTMVNRLEDGSDLDVDAYVAAYADGRAGSQQEPKVFRTLLPSARDTVTAVLLDGSSSLGVHHGRMFDLELACADALSRAMTVARERHGIFVFSGNTRHRVEVRCLKDFSDNHFALPSKSGLVAGGYTRLGAPIRHLTSRLLSQPAARRVLIVIGDGLISDEGYEGRYAWADVAHAVGEADEAGVGVYYLGLGPVRVDPLPEVFGARRSQRIRRVEELPRALAHVHRELVSA